MDQLSNYIVLCNKGTMEQKIYERQISKLSTAFRVVDEHQIDRHYNFKCQEELYEFQPNTQPKSTLNLPKVPILNYFKKFIFLLIIFKYFM